MGSKSGGGVDDKVVRELAALLDETGLSEIEIGRDGWHVRVAKGGTVVASAPVSVAGAMPAPANAVDAAPADAAAHPGAVPSPMVGVVYLAPDPDSPPYCKVGDQVAEGDTLCLIEAMKVFNPIRAPRAGKVTRILVSSGSPVEYGESLMVVE